MTALFNLTLKHLWYLDVPEYKSQAKERECMRCHKFFDSSWSGDRKCKKCEKLERILELQTINTFNKFGRYKRKEEI